MQSIGLFRVLGFQRQAFIPHVLQGDNLMSPLASSCGIFAVLNDTGNRTVVHAIVEGKRANITMQLPPNFRCSH